MTPLDKTITGIIIAAMLITAVALQTGPENTGKYADMSKAVTLVVNVGDLQLRYGNIYMAGIIVEVDPGINLVELFIAKEEIVIRVAAGNRVSIIKGDNGGF